MFLFLSICLFCRFTGFGSFLKNAGGVLSLDSLKPTTIAPKRPLFTKRQPPPKAPAAQKKKKMSAKEKVIEDRAKIQKDLLDKGNQN